MEVRKSLRDIVMFASLNFGDPFWFCDRLYIKAEPWENEDGDHVNTGVDILNGKGHIKIVYDSNAPYIEYKSTNTVNADSVIVHVQKGQIKNNGVSTVTR